MGTVFGPVPSRRLGRSLGIDLLPYKTCTYNCIYCQLGPTRRLTARRRAFISVDIIEEEVGRRLKVAKKVDFLTLSGSGEPTLYLHLEEVIGELKNRFQIPVAVITNSSLLYRVDVRKALRAADCVLPSLDACIDEEFRLINRPHPSLRLERIVEGLERFCNSYGGSVWLEVMLVKGINDSPRSIEALAQVVEQIRPERIQLNTVVRPPAEPWALPLEAEKLEEIRSILGPRAEVIATPKRSAHPRTRFPEDLIDAVHGMLRRRPLSLEDITQALGTNKDTIERVLNTLVREGLVQRMEHGGTPYYTYRRAEAER